MNTTDIQTAMRAKLAEAELKLRLREEAASVWRDGTDAEWAAAGDLHPSTAGQTSTKKERLALAAVQDRIAEKYRQDVAMFTAALAVLERGAKLEEALGNYMSVCGNTAYTRPASNPSLAGHKGSVMT